MKLNGIVTSIIRNDFSSDLIIFKIDSKGSIYKCRYNGFLPLDKTKNIGYQLKGTIPCIYSSDLMNPVAYRWRCQIEENAKQLAFNHQIPEMNHNEIVAWASSESNEHSLIYFSCEDIHPRIRSRMNWMLENIANENSWIIDCEGESLLERLLYASHISDWISIALALLRGVDPSEMGSIIELKSHLSKV